MDAWIKYLFTTTLLFSCHFCNLHFNIEKSINSRWRKRLHFETNHLAWLACVFIFCHLQTPGRIMKLQSHLSSRLEDFCDRTKYPTRSSFYFFVHCFYSFVQCLTWFLTTKNQTDALKSYGRLGGCVTSDNETKMSLCQNPPMASPS